MRKGRASSYLGLTFYLFLLLALVYTVFGGRDLTGDLAAWWKRTFGEPTQRTAWLRQARQENRFDDATLASWEEAFAAAKSPALSTDLPHREWIYFGRETATMAPSVAWQLTPGRRLTIEGQTDNPSPIFGELYDLARPNHPLASWDTLSNRLEYENLTATTLRLFFVLQAIPNPPASRLELRATTRPGLVFPVAGKDERAIQSKWGAPRDGGARRHEGNDIFAPRGTPLLAVARGRITRVGNGGLGGKTVWLEDGEGRAFRYYYAHLDAQFVRQGQTVERGDTLGLVGNTGNARTTPPHLHFGSYRGGAFDPFPLLRNPDKLPAAPVFTNRPQRVPERGNHYLRFSPARDGEIIRQLENGSKVTVIGSSGRFYRLKTERGEVGFANFE